ncbi:MAG: molecular chaperone TorD [Alphaproteobacteria bacterium]|nr:MAG: molecular chaperone TorD [Alphaproteobacteria bacterium]
MLQATATVQIAEEDQLRADWYALLARVLSDAPDEATLNLLRGLRGDGSELGRAVHTLAAAARAATPATAEREYFDLFIGIGQGELLPFGSYYLTGFLNEKPLARLRSDMAALGIARADDMKEPEDHIASLCEMMAGMITGAFGTPVDLPRQRDFFERHIASWAPRFFEDLEAARAAVLYMPVGTIGRIFMTIESEAFGMAA